MRTQCMFRGCSHSLIGIHVHSMCVRGVFNTHSLAFTCTHKHLRGVQYSLTGIHVHSQAFKVCSVLTQRRTFNDSKAVMYTHWVFTFTQWRSCALNGYLGAVQYSLIGIHANSHAFRRCSMSVQPVMYLKAK